MTVESSFHSEDIFAKAIERVEAGESIDVVLVSAPEEMRTELRDLLLLITATHHLQRAPVPQPPAPRRAERRAAFLQVAAQMKAEAAASTTVPARPPVAAGTAKPTPKRPAIADWLRDFWEHVQTGFSGPNLRLAPLVMLILAVWLGAFGFVSAAEAAGVGDLAYPVRQWMRYQELSLSSEKARGVIYNEIKDEILIDLVEAAAELRAEEKVSGAKVARISKELLIFEGIEDGYLLIGPLHVLMQYQPNPNVDQFVDMTMSTMPGVKDQVELTFQIIPSADPNAALPFVVQGISLEVPEVQLAIGPTPTFAPIAISTATVTVTASATPCLVNRPAGWVPYAVRSGDSLSTIAQRTGTTVAMLQQVNCIVNPNSISAGSNLFAPAIQQVNTPTTTQPPLASTLTAISTTTVTPTAPMIATVTPTVTIATTVTPTVAVTPGVTPTVAVTATLAPTATDALVATASPTVTATAKATTVATVTVSVTPTSTLLVVTSTPTPVLTPLPSATVTPTMASPDKATETATATGTPAPDTPVAPTVTASLTPEAETTVETTVETTATTESEGTGAGSSPTQRPTAVDTPTLLPATVTKAATATTEATTASTAQPHTPASTPTAPPTAPPTVAQSPTVAAAPTATDTPVPQNRSPLSGG